MPGTLYDKIWDRHVVAQESAEHPAVLFVDLHLVHEVTSPQAFRSLAERGLGVRRPDLTLATMDHSTPTSKLGVVDSQAAQQFRELEDNCAKHGIELHAFGSEANAIVHLIGPELGRTQPGMTIVCGDSHTSTHGAFGALAFGIGTSEVGHVLATQCLLQHKLQPFEIRIDGQLPEGVSSKDVILTVIGKLGTDGGTGYAFEYTGEAVRSMDMEARMTMCNMSIEAGARAGLVAPDDTTFEYLADKPAAPKGREFDAAVDRWRQLRTDDPRGFAGSVRFDASQMSPMITFGTHPGMVIPVDGSIPDPSLAQGDTDQVKRALEYMQLEPGRPLAGRPIDVVFIGSCTNSRLSDFRAAARVMEGRKVADNVRVLVVPGSAEVKRQAEREGLDQVFERAGAEWRNPGCSMCIAMNGDRLNPGEYAVSTSNRNFEGRQGRGGRTFLASPATAAASAVAGAVADPRPYVSDSGGHLV